MFNSLKQVRAWINLDGTHNLGPGPRQSAAEESIRYTISTCMTCACCVEACPNVSLNNKFIGAAPIAQTRLFNLHPLGAMDADERLKGLSDVGGIQDCGKAQVCVEVCPKQIPLTTHISAMNRALTGKMFRDLFAKDDPPKHGAAGPG